MSLYAYRYDGPFDLAQVGQVPLLRKLEPPVAAGAPSTFPRSYWDPHFRSYILALEFLNTDWEKKITLEPYPDPATTRGEIAKLYAQMGAREKRETEILTQDKEVFSYYCALLMIRPESHPRTFEVFWLGIVLGRVLLMHFKDSFNRVRPSQLAPDLAPMLTVPGHPSYPGGHVMQCRLMSLLVGEVCGHARASLLALADRIGENREIAGLHYASDTDAGRSLADQTFQHINKNLACLPKIGNLLNDLRAEWNGGTSP